MQISFSPIRSDDQLVLVKTGDVLTINGEDFDFSGVTEGAILPRAAVTCDWLGSDVTRTAGVLRLTLLLPHGANAAAATRFPSAITAADGPVPVPAHSEAI